MFHPVAGDNMRKQIAEVMAFEGDLNEIQRRTRCDRERIPLSRQLIENFNGSLKERNLIAVIFLHQPYAFYVENMGIGIDAMHVKQRAHGKILPEPDDGAFGFRQKLFAFILDDPPISLSPIRLAVNNNPIKIKDQASNHFFLHLRFFLRKIIQTP